MRSVVFEGWYSIKFNAKKNLKDLLFIFHFPKCYFSHWSIERRKGLQRWYIVIMPIFYILIPPPNNIQLYFVFLWLKYTILFFKYTEYTNRVKKSILQMYLRAVILSQKKGERKRDRVRKRDREKKWDREKKRDRERKKDRQIERQREKETKSQRYEWKW